MLYTQVDVMFFGRRPFPHRSTRASAAPPQVLGSSIMFGRR